MTQRRDIDQKDNLPITAARLQNLADFFNQCFDALARSNQAQEFLRNNPRFQPPVRWIVETEGAMQTSKEGTVHHEISVMRYYLPPNCRFGYRDRTPYDNAVDAGISSVLQSELKKSENEVTNDIRERYPDETTARRFTVGEPGHFEIVYKYFLVKQFEKLINLAGIDQKRAQEIISRFENNIEVNIPKQNQHQRGHIAITVKNDPEFIRDLEQICKLVNAKRQDHTGGAVAGLFKSKLPAAISKGVIAPLLGAQPNIARTNKATAEGATPKKDRK